LLKGRSDDYLVRSDSSRRHGPGQPHRDGAADPQPRHRSNKPGPLTVEYYRQRATAGLIIAEASPISPLAQGYLDTPGILVGRAGRRREVTSAVHGEAARSCCSSGVGRISHSSLLPDGAAPVSSTDRVANASTFTREGFVPVSSRALRDDEIPALIEDYRRRCATPSTPVLTVEMHAANTYLIEQFLRDSVNDRSGPTAAASRTVPVCCSKSLPPLPARSAPGARVSA
jgi:2,4-dienoyl-CoA reductase-like NADH-dependent reductase (Old Yellow Enzyme family)